MKLQVGAYVCLKWIDVFSSLIGDILGEPVITGIWTIIQMKEDGREEVLDNVNFEKGLSTEENVLIGLEENTRWTTQNCIM